MPRGNRDTDSWYPPAEEWDDATREKTQPGMGQYAPAQAPLPYLDRISNNSEAIESLQRQVLDLKRRADRMHLEIYGEGDYDGLRLNILRLDNKVDDVGSDLSNKVIDLARGIEEDRDSLKEVLEEDKIAHASMLSTIKALANKKPEVHPAILFLWITSAVSLALICIVEIANLVMRR